PRREGKALIERMAPSRSRGMYPPARFRPNLLYLVIGLVWFWLILFVIYPIVNIFLANKLDSYIRIFTTPYYRRVIWNTLALGGTVSFIGTAIAFIYAYTLARVEFSTRWRRLLHFVALIPTVAPPFVFGIS